MSCRARDLASHAVTFLNFLTSAVCLLFLRFSTASRKHSKTKRRGRRSCHPIRRRYAVRVTSQLLQPSPRGGCDRTTGSPAFFAVPSGGSGNESGHIQPALPQFSWTLKKAS